MEQNQFLEVRITVSGSEGEQRAEAAIAGLNRGCRKCMCAECEMERQGKVFENEGFRKALTEILLSVAQPI